MRAADSSDSILDRLLGLHPKSIDLVLDRVERLLAEMGNPERAIPPVVHIAGTNGKGSTQAMIRAGLEQAGHRVHAYTSPHLVRFHERIRLAGDLIAETELADILAECEARNAGLPITFFEITTVAAFVAFQRIPADYTLLEVGLGGRFDATNVITPKITAITPILLDHQQFLGDTIAEIATEKAGILKRGVPCVVAPQCDAARDVIEDRAARIGAPLLIAGQDWQVRAENGRMVFEDGDGLLDLDLPRLPGAHQIDNAGTAIAVLRGLGQGADACAAGPRDAEWPARMQRLVRGPLVDRLRQGQQLWLDGGHNAGAGTALARHLATTGPVALVLGMLQTKAAEDFLRPLAPLVSEVRTVQIPNAVSSFDANELAIAASAAGHHASSAATVGEAIADLASRHDRLLIAGSLYLAGHVLGENG